MTKPKIAIILSTTRAARFGHKAGQWIYDIAKQRHDIDVELIDLRDYPLPFFDEVATNAWAPNPKPRRRSLAEEDRPVRRLYLCHRGVQSWRFGGVKNALDFAYPEWNRKAAAFLGYGGVGAARAIEQLRLILIELQMAPTRSAVHFAGNDFMAALREGKPIADFGYLKPAADAMLDELAWWTSALKVAREATEKKAARRRVSSSPDK